ncbi:MAG: RNA pseudouridine synthase, partial [Candidatus Krumholzibacteria bacterium]|nr:RNA pseudouridine synthase [Candidatus Krumholzibacteria bacterium]
GTKVTSEKLLKIMTRHALHASLLSFSHPVSEKWLTFRAALPPDMGLALETLYTEDRFKEV